MTMIKVAPAQGRTVRFPAGHERQGDEIPAEGALIDAGSAFVKRYILTGDLRVIAETSKPSVLRRTVGIAYQPSTPIAESPFDGVESLDFDPEQLRSYSIKRLLELAERAGVEVPPKASKAALIEAITAASAPIDEDT